MEYGGTDKDHFGLPEDQRDQFDERELEEAIREHRRRELEGLVTLNT